MVTEGAERLNVRCDFPRKRVVARESGPGSGAPTPFRQVDHNILPELQLPTLRR